MSDQFLKASIKAIQEMSSNIGVNETANEVLIKCHNGLQNRNKDVFDLVNNYTFIDFCKDELNLNIKDELIFFDDLIKDFKDE